MEYVSTSEIAKIWDVSRCRVTTLCREGRIEGAVFAANTWLVPKDAKNRKIQEESVKWDGIKIKIENRIKVIKMAII